MPIAALFYVVSWYLTAPGCAAQVERPDGQVDFAQSILPILEQHCYKCHSTDQADGELRLDSRLGIAKGGHTGSPILGTTPENSELFRRITSDEVGYRMPKEGDPAIQTSDRIDRFVD